MGNPAPGFRKVPRSHIVLRPAGKRLTSPLQGSVA